MLVELVTGLFLLDVAVMLNVTAGGVIVKIFVEVDVRGRVVV